MQNFIKLLLITLLVSSCQAPNSKTLVIGHRGARGHVAENTLASISKAIELGVDGVEIDVFRCATGELVVFHDKTLDKLIKAEGNELSVERLIKLALKQL